MIKLPKNNDLDAQFLEKYFDIPGDMLCIKIKKINNIHRVRVSNKEGCSCCGQYTIIRDIQSENMESIYFYIKDHYSNINTLLLQNINIDTFSYNPNQEPYAKLLVKNYKFLENFFEKIEKYILPLKNLIINFIEREKIIIPKWYPKVLIEKKVPNNLLINYKEIF